MKTAVQLIYDAVDRDCVRIVNTSRTVQSVKTLITTIKWTQCVPETTNHQDSMARFTGRPSNVDWP